jgi:hypothetical protein
LINLRIDELSKDLAFASFCGILKFVVLIL